MANQEHLVILEQGIETWNQWRQEHPEIRPDLSGANLSFATFSNANLNGANLSRADLSRADLNRANLSRADLSASLLIGVDLSEADLSLVNLSNADLSASRLIGATLRNADLSLATLSNADFSGADLRGTIFRFATLSFANLSDADLGFANLSDANLSNVNLSNSDLYQAATGWTYFADVDLRHVKGLETLRHFGPSHISIDTIYRSEGYIPEDFLRKAGVQDSFIKFMHSLVIKPINYYTCFISYSSKDDAFVEQLYKDLQTKGVRCWYPPEDMKIGDKIRLRVDESIRMYDKLLLVLSEHSVRSPWVEHEVEMALAKEQKSNHKVLFPIRLDNAIIEIDQDGWPLEVKHTRNIGDFTGWKQHEDYQQALERLLRDLQAEA